MATGKSAGAVTGDKMDEGEREISGEDLAHLFPEMAGYVGQCKFGLSCQHDREPGCAIRKAVVSGEISPQRYKSYMNLRGEL